MSNKRTKVSDAVARPTRTAAQMTPAAVITELWDVFIYDMDDPRAYVAVFAGLTILFGWIQTLIENHYEIGFLRNVPPTESPVVDTEDGGQ